MVDIILIGLSYFRERLSQDISFKLKKVPLYFVLGALGYTVYGSLLSINGVMLSVFSFIVFASIVLVVVLGLYRLRVKKIFKCKFSCFGKVTKSDFILWIVFVGIVGLVVSKMLQRMAFPSFDIDLFGHLLSKAKIFLFTTYKDAFFLHDPLFANLHSNYPPLFGIFYNLLFLFLTLSCSFLL